MTTERTNDQFTQDVERNLRGVFFFSVGACPGCADCGLASPCEHCDGYGVKEDESQCEACNGTGTHEPTDHERDIANEAHFSWSQCESCGSNLGGDRHPAHGIIAESVEHAQSKDRDITHFDVCSDCLFYHANGDLPFEK